MINLPQLQIRQIVAATLIVVAVGLAFWLLYRFHQVVIIFFVAVVVSTAIQPLARRLHRFGIPRAGSVVLVYLFLLAALAGFVWLLAPLALAQATRLAATLPDAYAAAREAMLTNQSFFIWRLALVMPEQLPVVGLASFENGDVTTAVQQGAGAATLLLKSLFGVTAVLVLAFYWTLDKEVTIRSLLLWLPLSWRESARDFVTEAEARVGAFVTGQALLSVTIGSMALVAYLLLDLPYAVGLAVVAGVFELVPILGPVLGAVPALIVAYSVDPVKAIWVIAATIIIQQLENSLLLPRIMNRSVGVHPLVTLLSIMAFGLLFGIAGALVAIPIAAVLQLVFERTFTAEQAAPDGRDQLSVLRYEVQDLVQDIRKQIRFKEAAASAESDQIEDLLETIAADLDQVLVINRQRAAGSQQ